MRKASSRVILALLGLGTAMAAFAQAAGSKPNIVVIMGDDIGIWNIGAYHRGMMAGRTPNLDKLAAEGMLFTDYYAEASCTAGRANFITGELPIRTGMTTVGQAGAPTGLPAAGGDHRHGAEVDGLRHRPVRQESPRRQERVPADRSRLRRVLRVPLSPRRHGGPVPPGLSAGALEPGRPAQPDPLLGHLHRRCDGGPALGEGRKAEDRRRRAALPERMETVDDEIRDLAFKFVDKAKADGKPFFLWLNPTRMHIVTHLSPKYQALRNSKNGWTIHEAGMAQLDDIVGATMQKLKDLGVDDNTIVVFTTDNGTEVFTWPDGGQTPFAQSKGTVMEGGFRAPAMIRWPGHVPAGKVENGLISGLDWFPTFVTAAGNPNISEQLLKGVNLGGRTYKVHLDGYDQTNLITGKGPSNRHEIFYFGESSLGAVRIDDFKFRFIDQPNGWVGEKTRPDVPYITNLRLDPFERTGWPGNGTKDGAQEYFSWFQYEFWRFVFVQEPGRRSSP